MNNAQAKLEAMKLPRSSRLESYVSPAMIAAGVQVLRESGVLFAESSADALVVHRILKKALAVYRREQKNSLSEHSGPQTQGES